MNDYELYRGCNVVWFYGHYYVFANSGSSEPRHDKTGFCICENKDADQLSGNREAGQRLFSR